MNPNEHYVSGAEVSDLVTRISNLLADNKIPAGPATLFAMGVLFYTDLFQHVPVRAHDQVVEYAVSLARQAEIIPEKEQLS